MFPARADGEASTKVGSRRSFVGQRESLDSGAKGGADGIDCLKRRDSMDGRGLP